MASAPIPAGDVVALSAPSAGKQFERITYAPGPLADTEVEVKVTHSSLCHTDVHMRDNDWGASVFPLIAGHEVVGLVDRVGDHVKHLKKGDRVGLFWIRDSCRACNACIRGEENVCEAGYSGLILGGHKGGFQDRVQVPADFAMKIPDSLSSVDAAPLLCAGLTVYAPVRDYIKHPATKFGVVGIGGLGHLALQFANKFGAEVTAFSSSPSKEEEARSFGAHKFVAYDPKAAPGAGFGVAKENQVDVLLYCAPVLPPDGDFRNFMGLVRTNGTLVLAGIPPTSNGTVGLLDLIFNQKKLVGSIVGGRLVMNEMLEFCGIHGIKPKTQTMKLSQLNEAMDLVVANKARYRIVLENDLV